MTAEYDYERECREIDEDNDKKMVKAKKDKIIEAKILLSKYNQFPKYELKLMGLIPKIENDK